MAHQDVPGQWEESKNEFITDLLSEFKVPYKDPLVKKLEQVKPGLI